jgi:hypothetical protein
MTFSSESPIESGAKFIRQMARRFLVIGIINIIAGIIITAIGWPGGLFSVFVGVIELVNASRFWSTPPRRKRAPMYVAVLEISNIFISLGSFWSLIAGIMNVVGLKSPDVKAFFVALNSGDVLTPGMGQSTMTGQFKRCPKCAEPIQLEAVVCRYCGHQITAEEVSSALEDAESRRLEAEEATRNDELSATAKRFRLGGWILLVPATLFFVVGILVLVGVGGEKDPSLVGRIFGRGIAFLICVAPMAICLWLFVRADRIRKQVKPSSLRS